MSTPKRFFIEEISEEVALEGDEFRHAKSVLRLREGDEVTLLDGSGKEYAAIVARVEKARLLLHVTGEHTSDREPMSEICLLIGLLKGDKTELVVQKATELGVSRILVFSSRYVAAYMNGNKLERLNRVAHEAAKQCLRAKSPAVEYFETLESALRAAAHCESKLFACEFLTENEGSMTMPAGSCALVIGSEGGFSEEEFALAQSLGYKGITLGKRILRAETAAIAALAVVAHAMGELG
ncbi:MAG: 16S rRNA (uracil(1498)-N(3))-methyltransferase [Clostridia bacterium]|nr:16S rRNA (uracil(1498)-N(3))-methyltransferase [Clostridia bacterium]